MEIEPIDPAHEIMLLADPSMICHMLHYACVCGKISLLRMLIAKGADIYGNDMVNAIWFVH